MKEEKINLSVGRKRDFEIEDLVQRDIGGAKVTTWKPQEIETQIVQASMKETDFRENLNKPFLFIIFPFFAPKKKRNINIIYAYDDIGLEFLAEIKGKNHLENLNNQQPSDFERNVFEFILHKFQMISSKLSNEMKAIVKEQLEKEEIFEFNSKKARIRRKEIMLDLIKEKNLENKKIEFSISEIIAYLNLKNSPKYYKRIEEALYNLQSTTYSFKIRNKRKVKGIVRQEIYSEPLNLIKYYKLREKSENGRWRVFYQVTLSRNIFEELIIKSYSIFDKDNLLKIRKENQPSEKLYQYICMKRYNNEYEFSIETISTIAGFSLMGTINKKMKDGTIKKFKVRQVSKIKKKLEFAYQKLVEMGYLQSFDVIEKEGKKFTFKHIFNDQEALCHKTDFINVIPSPDELEKDEILIEANEDSFEKGLKKIRKNIYFEKKYNERIKKLLLKIYNNNGEKIYKDLTNKIYSGLNSDIKRSLSSYISTVLKEIKTNLETGKEDLKNSMVKENPREYKRINQKIQSKPVLESKTEQIKKEAENIYINMYNALPELAKEEVKKVAYSLFVKELKVEKVTEIHNKIYNSIRESYIIRVLKGEK